MAPGKSKLPEAGSQRTGMLPGPLHIPQSIPQVAASNDGSENPYVLLVVKGILSSCDAIVQSALLVSLCSSLF